jgi:hypothetical protein
MRGNVRVMNGERNTQRTLTCPPSVWKRVDDYRFTAKHRRESDAIRAILEAGLDALSVPVREKEAAE